MDHAAKIKQDATELGNCRKRLKTRLQSAVGALHRDKATLFKHAAFDFENKQLVSKCGQFALVWSPEHTSTGIVKFCSL